MQYTYGILIGSEQSSAKAIDDPIIEWSPRINKYRGSSHRLGQVPWVGSPGLHQNTTGPVGGYLSYSDGAASRREFLVRCSYAYKTVLDDRADV